MSNIITKYPIDQTLYIHYNNKGVWGGGHCSLATNTCTIYNRVNFIYKNCSEYILWIAVQNK